MNPFNISAPKENPFNTTTLGIVTNTFLGLPQASLDVASNIFHGITRSLGSAGLTLMGQDQITPPTSGAAKNVFDFLYGADQGAIKNLQTRIAESEINIQRSPIAQKLGMDKFALPLAFGGVMGDVALNLTWGGGEENIAKQLLKETQPENIAKILLKMDVPEELIPKFADTFAKAVKPEEVKQGLDLLKSSIGLKNVKNATPLLDNAVSKTESTLQDNILQQTRQAEEAIHTQVQNTLPLSKLATAIEDQSLRPIIAESVKTVKDKANIMSYLGTPEFVLERVGLAKEADLLQTASDAIKKQLPEEINKLISWKNIVKDIPNAAKNIFKFLDGQDVKLSTKELGVATQMKTYLSSWADKLDLPEEKRITNYITHIFEKDFLKKEFDPDLAKIIDQKVAGSVYDPFLLQRLGAKGFKEDAFAAVDAYVKRAVRKVNMDPALEALKTAANKLDNETYKYIMDLSHRINLRPTHVDNLIDNFIKSTPIGYRLGQRPIAVITTTVRQIFYRGMLGLNVGSALRNLTQGINTYAKLGEKYTLIGYSKLIIRMISGNLREFYDSGVLAQTLIEDKKIGVYKTFFQKLDPFLFSLFELAEKINRGAAYFGAKAKYIAEGKTELEAIKMAKRLVRETQFAFGNVDSPVFMSSDIVKTLTQFSTYNIKQTEFLIRMAKNKEFGGLLRFSLASVGILLTIGKLLGMQPADLIPTTRLGGSPVSSLVSNISGMFSNNKQTEAQSKTSSKNQAIALFPAGGQIRKSIQGYQAVSQGKSTTAKGNTQYKIPRTLENYLRAIIFGKSTLPQAQEYFKSFNQPKKTGNPFNL